jgi:hypothetical protein
VLLDAEHVVVQVRPVEVDVAVDRQERDDAARRRGRRDMDGRRAERGNVAQAAVLPQISAGRISSANVASGRQRERITSAAAGNATKRRFDALIPVPIPAASPASAPSHASSLSSARTAKYALTSSATVDGKSDIAVNPSACGRNCSVHFAW